MSAHLFNQQQQILYHNIFKSQGRWSVSTGPGRAGPYGPIQQISYSRLERFNRTVGSIRETKY